MFKTVTIENMLQMENPLCVDVRSPVEFSAGNIPGAVNVPLFTDDERVQVGTLYKTAGGEAAKKLGLSIVSPKLAQLVEEIGSISAAGRPVIVYCWRGGMRSKSIVNVLAMMDIPVYQLIGGYKSYRHYVLDSLANFLVKPLLICLCGPTGTGKTALLGILKKKGAAVLDLEKMANHRGSVFGQVGLGKPSTAQNFDAALLAELHLLNEKPYLIVEYESKRIGNVYLPEKLFQAMQRGRKILLNADMEIRITRLTDEYLDVCRNNRQEILECIKALHKRLGGKRTSQMVEEFQKGSTRWVVRSLLTDYYDPLYGYGSPDLADFDCCINADCLEQAAEEIMGYLDQLGRSRIANCR